MASPLATNQQRSKSAGLYTDYCDIMMYHADSLPLLQLLTLLAWSALVLSASRQIVARASCRREHKLCLVCVSFIAVALIVAGLRAETVLMENPKVNIVNPGVAKTWLSEARMNLSALPPQFGPWPRGARLPNLVPLAKAAPLFYNWELLSIRSRMYHGAAELASPVQESELAQCLPPPGVPKSCCMGSVSHGGEVSWPDLAADSSGHRKPARYRFCFDSLAHYADQAKRAFPTELGVQAAYTTRALRLLAARRPHGGSFNHIFVIGDSLMSQFNDAAQCAWLREGSTQEQVTPKVVAGADWRHRIFGDTVRTVTIPPSAGGGGAGWGGEPLTARVGGAILYRPNITAIEARLATTDTIVVNFGLHFLHSAGDQGAFRTQVKELFTTLREWVVRAPAERRMAFWRETTPQHLDSEGGEWPRSIYKKLAVDGLYARTGMCTPLSYGSHVNRMWRAALVRALAEEVGFYIVEVNRTTGEVMSRGDSAKGESARAAASAAAGRAPLFWVSVYADLEPEAGLHATVSSWQQMPLNVDQCKHTEVDGMETCALDGACEPTHYCYSPYVWKKAWAQIVALLEAHRATDVV